MLFISKIRRLSSLAAAKMPIFRNFSYTIYIRIHLCSNTHHPAHLWHTHNDHGWRTLLCPYTCNIFHIYTKRACDVRKPSQVQRSIYRQCLKIEPRKPPKRFRWHRASQGSFALCGPIIIWEFFFYWVFRAVRSANKKKTKNKQTTHAFVISVSDGCGFAVLLYIHRINALRKDPLIMI